MQKFILVGFQLFFRAVSFISTRLAGKLSFRLSYYPRSRSKIRAHEVALMKTAHKEFVEVNNKQVVVYSWGSGPPVLLVHGHESRASRYVYFVEKLVANGFMPISFDAPGHGESGGSNTDILEYEMIFRQLEKNYGKFACIVSHSVGVMCSFYAIKNGVSTNKIVAINGVCQLSYITKQIAQTLKLSEKVLLDLNRRMELMFTSISDIWNRFSADEKGFSVQGELLIIHDNDDDVVEFAQSHRLYLQHSPATPIMQTSGLGHSRILYDKSVIDSVISFIKQ